MNFLKALFPPDLTSDFLRLGLAATWQTLAYAVAGITLAVLLGFPLGIAASGSAAGSPKAGLSLVVAVRLLLAALRSVHELVWAVLFVAAFGLSSLTAILALALPYAGILGRIYGELFNQVPRSHCGRCKPRARPHFGCFFTADCPWPCPK